MVLGGLLPALQLAREAADQGLEAYVTSSLDGVIARAGATHLAAALPSGRYASGLGVGHLFKTRALRASPSGRWRAASRFPRAGARSALMSWICPVLAAAEQCPRGSSAHLRGPAVDLCRVGWRGGPLGGRAARSRRGGGGIGWWCSRRTTRRWRTSSSRSGRLGAVMAPLNARLTRAELAPLAGDVRPPAHPGAWSPRRAAPGRRAPGDLCLPLARARGRGTPAPGAGQPASHPLHLGDDGAAQGRGAQRGQLPRLGAGLRGQPGHASGSPLAGHAPASSTWGVWRCSRGPPTTRGLPGAARALRGRGHQPGDRRGGRPPTRASWPPPWSACWRRVRTGPCPPRSSWR